MSVVYTSTIALFAAEWTDVESIRVDEARSDDEQLQIMIQNSSHLALPYELLDHISNNLSEIDKHQLRSSCRYLQNLPLSEIFVATKEQYNNTLGAPLIPIESLLAKQNINEIHSKLKNIESYYQTSLYRNLEQLLTLQSDQAQDHFIEIPNHLDKESLATLTFALSLIYLFKKFDDSKSTTLAEEFTLAELEAKTCCGRLTRDKARLVGLSVCPVIAVVIAFTSIFWFHHSFQTDPYNHANIGILIIKLVGGVLGCGAGTFTGVLCLSDRIPSDEMYKQQRQLSICRIRFRKKMCRLKEQIAEILGRVENAELTFISDLVSKILNDNQDIVELSSAQ